MSFGDSLGRAALDFIFPPKCILCRTLLPPRSGEMCPDCLAAWAKHLALPCPRCALGAARCRCSYSIRTLGEHPTTLGFYVGHTDRIGRLVYSFKRRYDRDITRFFARELATQIMRNGKVGADTVITYPARSPKAIRKYGFDHGRMLARRTARFLGCAFSDTLERKSGAEQKTLTASERAQNVAGIFSPRKGASIYGRRVILVDDIITTGATMSEAARVLRDAGAVEIRFASLFTTVQNASSRSPWFEEGEGSSDADEWYDIAAEDVGF